MAVAGTHSPAMSLVEALANVLAGYGIAVLTQLLIFPLFGLVVAFGDSLLIGAAFTVVSVGRSYLLRRIFERLRATGRSGVGSLQRQNGG
ncbi:DUF7220 family protein [Bauldia litoralis]|uniref:Uncharacterized protein n=1 Tax=Bauldia litoralis TaxID=665467 RepID=A0A1G6BHU8_9HYPH|nr:hypothetical protein [Bauldia litoralis]SDB20221.1 hypothetical protein SAMN02982931_01474 [Bauldia litoralis]